MFRLPDSSSSFPAAAVQWHEDRPFPGTPFGVLGHLALAPHSLFSVPSWHSIIVDGHSVEELCKAFGQAKHQPTAIIAKTFKGRGITGP